MPENDDVFVSFSDDESSYVEEHAVEEGEYQVRITSANVNSDKGFIQVRMEIVGDPYAKEVSAFINLPGSGRTEKEENNNRRRRLNFMSCFDMDPSGQYRPSAHEPEGYVGREGYVMISAPRDKDDGYGPQNSIKRFSPQR